MPTLVMLAVLAVTLSAGRWQLDRAAGKLALQQRIEAAADAPPVSLLTADLHDAQGMSWQPVEAVGRFDPDRQVFVDNRLRNGVPGYEVLAALRLSGSPRVLLVNRGWVAAPRSRDELPAVPLPTGDVRLVGLAYVPSRRFMELRAGTDDASRWQNWTIERASERWATDLMPVALLQTADAVASGRAPDGSAATGAPDTTDTTHSTNITLSTRPTTVSTTTDTLARDWPRPDVGIDKHRGYALQFFSFAFIAGVVWLVLSLRRLPTTPDNDDVSRTS